MNLHQAIAIHDSWGAKAKAFQELLAAMQDPRGRDQQSSEALKEEVVNRLRALGGDEAADQLAQANELIEAAGRILRERGTPGSIREHQDDAELSVEAQRLLNRTRS